MLEIMKDKLDMRTRQIADLMKQLRLLKESYHLELGSLHADLKCAQMENMLHKKEELTGSSLDRGRKQSFSKPLISRAEENRNG